VALAGEACDRAIVLTKRLRQVVVLRSEEKQTATVPVFVLEARGHRLHRAPSSLIEAEHNERAVLERAPELFFDFPVVSHLPLHSAVT